MNKPQDRERYDNLYYKISLILRIIGLILTAAVFLGAIAFYSYLLINLNEWG